MPLQHPVMDLDDLASIHAVKRLFLATGVGLQGFIHLNGDREAMVDQLIRLARIGQYCERKAIEDPTRLLRQAVDESQNTGATA